MDVRLVSVVLGLLAAGLPAWAQNSAAPAAGKVAQPAAHRTAHAKTASKSAVPAAYAAIPEAERLAIQSDLVWLGGYEGMSAEEFDGHTIDAIKAFQKRNNGKETGVLTEQERALLANAAKGPAAAVGWRLLEDSATGARLGVPEKLVARSGPGRTGSRWSSRQGQVQIETFRLHEASLPALFEDERKTAQRRVGSSALGANSFFIAGEQRLKKFVVRAQTNGSEVRGVTILYDQATEGTMAPVAIAVADTFQGFPDPNAGPLPGRGRSVEYGTAIVATSRGDVIASERVTDQCQSITVPPFGHADRVAVDKTNGLALLRLYGARNLAPATLAAAGDTSDQLALVGIADPLAQPDAAAAIKAGARLTAQGLDPPPKPGFAGAAVIDARGQFAGLVDLKSPAVAGAAAIPQQASLVPAETVRTFLRLQGITPGNGRTPIDQSVLRVICVRK